MIQRANAWKVLCSRLGKTSLSVTCFQKGHIGDFVKFSQQYNNRHLLSVYYVLGIALHVISTITP